MADSYSIKAVFSLKDEMSSRLKAINHSMGEVADQPKKISASLGAMLKGAGVFAVVNAGISTLKSSLTSAVSRFDTLNVYPKIMQQMGYSSDDARDAVRTLKKGIDGLPTSLDEITKSAQSFAILTHSATKGAQTATALNDALLASGASSADAGRGVQQYSQMLAAGKVDMQSWRTLAETMPYALKEVAKSFGITGDAAQQELYQKLQSGQITMQELNERFIQLDGGAKGFAATAHLASGGIGNSFQNMKLAVTRGLADMLSAINAGIKDAGINGGLAEIFLRAKNVIDASFQSINGIVRAMLPIMIGVIGQIYNAVDGMIDFVNANKDWLLPLMLGVGSFAATIKVINGVSKAIQVIKVASAVANDVQLLGFALKNMANDSLLAKAALAAYNFVVRIATAVQAAFNAVSFASSYTWIIAGIVAVVAALTWFFTQTNAGREIWQSFMTWLTAVWQDFSSFTKPVWSMVAAIVQDAWNSISAVIKTTTHIITDVINLFLAVITGNWFGAWEALKSLVGYIWGAIVGIISSYVGLVTNVVGTIAHGAVNVIWNVWGGLTRIVGSLWSGIGSVIRSAVRIDLYGAGRAIIDGFCRGLKASFEGVKNFVGGIANWIKQHKGPISYDAHLLTPAGNSIMDGLNQGLNDRFKKVQSSVAGMSDHIQSRFNDSMSASASSSWTNYNEVELNQNNATNVLLQEIVAAIKKGQILAIDGQALIGATASGYDNELGKIVTNRSRNQL